MMSLKYFILMGMKMFCANEFNFLHSYQYFKSWSCAANHPTSSIIVNSVFTRQIIKAVIIRTIIINIASIISSPVSLFGRS